MGGDDRENELKIQKLENQITTMQSKVKFRTIEEMPLNLRSRWIPLEVLNEFMISRGNKPLLYDETTNIYEVDLTHSKGTVPSEYNFYGDLIRHLNNLGLEHGVQNKDREEAIEEFKERFRSWLAVHPKRQEFENTYNRKFNNYVKEEYDDTPIPIDKMDDGFSLNRYHYSAIRRMLDVGRGILAYGTGLGKTFAAIATAYLLKERGIAKKPMIVVPKSVLANWVSEINVFSGNKKRKIMIIGMHEKKDKNETLQLDVKGKIQWNEDTFEEVQRKLQQVAQNDYDIVLITRDKFDMMSFSPEILQRTLDDVVHRHIIRSNAEATARDVEVAKANIERAIMGRVKAGHEKVETIYFDQLGVDALFADEAHSYRNLFGLVGRPIKWAMTQPDVQRSMRMYVASQFIREKNNGKNVFFLTATPTVNNPLEAYNMLQYIAPEEYDRRNIFNMQDFFDTFGNVETLDIADISGEIKPRPALTGFKALPELRTIFMRYTDMRRAQDVGLKVPQPDPHFNTSNMTTLQKRVYNDLRERARELLAMTEEERKESGDHIFSILSDMQKAAISIKLLMEEGSEHRPELTSKEVEEEGVSPKMKESVEDTLRIYKTGEKQLIFAEFKAIQKELKNELIKAGIPEKDILIINADTAGSSSNRQHMSEEYNSGKYKVVIGNSTMAEGMNFQVETSAVNHLTLPWTPAAIEQRNGRGVRQGNKREMVDINYYMTHGTFDGFFFDAINRKKGWQWDLWNGTADEAKNENSGRSFSPQELQVMLSDDPEAERLKVDAENKTQIEKNREEMQKRGLSAFNQYQNLLIQYKKMKPEEKSDELGKQLQERITYTRQLLQNNEQFEYKGLLESDEPAYVDADRRIVVPVGRYFTRNGGNWEKHGLYRFVSVDPVNRRVKIEKIIEGEQREYDHANPSPGEISNVGFNEFKSFFKSGISTPAVHSDEVERKLYDSIKNWRQVRLLQPDTITNKKENIFKILEENDVDDIPVIDHKTGGVKIAARSDFEPKEEYNRRTGQTENLPPTYSKDDIYWPLDIRRWMKDILDIAQKERTEYRKIWAGRNRHYKPPMPKEVNFANEVFGWQWPSTEEEVPEEENTEDQE